MKTKKISITLLLLFVSLSCIFSQVNASNDIAYVLNMDGNYISVVDMHNDNKVIKTISQDINGPSAIAITPNRKYAYITNAGNNSVAVLDIGNDNQIIRSITKDINSPYGIAITPNGKYVYVASLGNDSITVIDIENENKVVHRITQGILRPYAITITPNGKYGYVTNLGNSSISVIDLGSNKVIQSIDKGINNPFSIAITPNGKYAYIVSGGNNSISVIDIENDNQIIQTIVKDLNDPYAIAITPNGNYAYVANYTGSISVIDLAHGNKVIQTINEHIERPYAVAITSNGKYAYIANLNNDSLTVIDIEDGNKVVKVLTEDFCCPYGIAFVASNSTNSLCNSELLAQKLSQKDVSCCHLHDENFLFDETESMRDYLTAFPCHDYTLYYSNDTGYLCIDDVNDPIKNILREGKIWEPHVHDQIKKYALPATTVLDIGAHIGTETLVMANCVGKTGNVHTFEPQKKNFRELWVNCVVNQIDDRVNLYRMAIGSTHKTIDIGRIVESSDGEVDEGGIGVWGGGDNTEMRAIDSFNFSNVSLVKIDVEGCENDVLDGMVQTIRNNQPVIVIEICGGWVWDTAPPDIRSRILVTKKKLSDLGYETYHLNAWDYIAFPKNSAK